MTTNERMRVVCAGDCRDARSGSPAGEARDAEWRRICAVEDVPRGGMKAFPAGGLGVLVVDLGGKLVAVQSLCPHEMVPLAQGAVEGWTLTCLEHMWQFDLTTGAPLGEATEGLRTYRVKNLDGNLYVAVE